MDLNFKRIQILFMGQVQGVGFRPHVYRLARQLELTGFVQNNASGVLVEIQGTSTEVFLPQLMFGLPSLAKVDRFQTKIISPKTQETDFQIIESTSGLVNTLISPDVSICYECLQELFDPNSRYYLYPFLNCTNCGPRLTITNTLPYDRRHTSMKDFPLCQECRIEYLDPLNRRYHAQPTSCTACGPKLEISIQQIVNSIQNGDIVALKGLGGYQLICDAKNKDSVIKLRSRKKRDAKPFALMVLNINSAKKLVKLCKSSEQLLDSKERPIVLLPKYGHSLAEEIAPGLSRYGVMLPYTPVHYLLFHALAGNPKGHEWLKDFNPTVLVVTSANSGGDPLIADDENAKRDLESIADKIISYNREIVCRADDSVMQVIQDAPFFIRRARGFVPQKIKLPYEIPSTLALGGFLKNTFCITRKDEAFVSQHIGSLNNKSTIAFFHDSLHHLMNLLNLSPKRIAHDMHPDFFSTRFAEEFDLPLYPIQHHHAHLAAVAAEHQITQSALGLALDGYGYGLKGELWGGELLLLKDAGFERVSSFYPIPQPGGDKAVREPWRMAASVMQILGQGDEIINRFKEYSQAALLSDMLKMQINIPSTSSCGRVFDAASSILGINCVSQYEGQAAMQLESLVTQPEVLGNGWKIENQYFNFLPTLNHLFDMDPVTGANIFHGTLIRGLADWISQAAEKFSVNIILLSGGCFLNKVLTEGLTKELLRKKLNPLLSKRVPSNDGGLSLGQAWVAGRL